MFRAMRYRNYRWFWFGRIGQSIGLAVQQFSMAWLVLDLTDDSLSQLGLVVSLQGLPMIGFLIFGGVLTDRLDRLRVLMSSQLLLVVAFTVLATLTLTELVTIWHIYIAAVLVGIIQGFGIPARLALVRDLVDRWDVMNAVALSFVLMNVAFMTGPLLAGAVIDWLGLGPAFYLTAFLYLMGALTLLLIRGVTSHRGPVSTTMVQDLVEALRYVKSSPAVLSIIVLGFVLAFFGESHNHLLPAFAKEVLELGPARAGMLMAAVGFGALTGGLALAALGDFRHKNWLWLGMILLFTIGLFSYAIAPWFGLTLVLLFLTGMGDLNFVSLGAVLLQLLVPQALLGRVMGLWSIGASFMFIGVLPMGVVGDLIGLRYALAGGAIICFVFFLWLGIVRTPIRRMAAV